MRGFRPACVLLTGLLCTAVAAHAEFRSVPDRKYREYFGEPSPVKGETLVGVSVVPNAAEQRSNTLQVLLPVALAAAGEQTIRVEAASADGLFRGVGEFRDPAATPGWTTLDLDPPPSGKQRPADELRLAVAVRGARPNEFLVARWGSEPATDDARVRLYVNSRRGDMSLKVGDSSVPCTAIPGGPLVRFDAVCDVALADIPADGRVRLMRRDAFNRSYQDVFILR